MVNVTSQLSAFTTRKYSKKSDEERILAFQAAIDKVNAKALIKSTPTDFRFQPFPSYCKALNESLAKAKIQLGDGPNSLESIIKATKAKLNKLTARKALLTAVKRQAPDLILVAQDTVKQLVSEKADSDSIQEAFSSLSNLEGIEDLQVHLDNAIAECQVIKIEKTLPKIDPETGEKVKRGRKPKAK